MNLDSTLSDALDEFAGLCAVGDLSRILVEPLQDNGYLTAKISGVTYVPGQEFPIAIWDSHEGAGATWLQLGDRTLNVADDQYAQTVIETVPPAFLRDVASGIGLALALRDTAMDALECAETMGDLDSILRELSRTAAAGRTQDEYQGEALIAETNLLLNLANSLFTGVAIAESPDMHLEFDIEARIIDPDTGTAVEAKVCWMESGKHNEYTHAYQIGTSRCLAHVESDVYRLMAEVPAESRAHYVHAFDHLHQAAHALSDYAAAKVGEALAAASTVDEPLLAVGRHNITHQVHKAVVAEINELARSLSEEPGTPANDS